MANVVDIRGHTVRPETRPVLADPSGARARWLARAGGAMALVLLLWLAGLGLAGLGILPGDALPLGRAVSAPAPPVLRGTPVPTRPTRSDLSAATPSAPASDSGVGRPGQRSGAHAPPGTHGAPVSGTHARSVPHGRSAGRPATPARPRRSPGTIEHGTSPVGVGDTKASPTRGATPARRHGGVMHGTGRVALTAPGQTVKPGYTHTTAHAPPRARSGQVNAGTTTAATTTNRGWSGTSPSHTVTTVGRDGNGA